MKVDENGTLKVSRLENWLDTGEIVMKIAGAAVGICVSVFTISRCTRALNYKKNDPTGYWNHKLGSNETSRAVDRLAEAITDAANKFCDKL